MAPIGSMMIFIRINMPIMIESVPKIYFTIVTLMVKFLSEALLKIREIPSTIRPNERITSKIAIVANEKINTRRDKIMIITPDEIFMTFRFLPLKLSTLICISYIIFIGDAFKLFPAINPVKV
jgi:hypothetical protein